MRFNTKVSFIFNSNKDRSRRGSSEDCPDDISTVATKSIDRVIHSSASIPQKTRIVMKMIQLHDQYMREHAHQMRYLDGTKEISDQINSLIILRTRELGNEILISDVRARRARVIRILRDARNEDWKEQDRWIGLMERRLENVKRARSKVRTGAVEDEGLAQSLEQLEEQHKEQEKEHSEENPEKEQLEDN